MCVISEISQRAKEYCHALLTGGYITDEQYQAVLEQVKEQLALCTTAMMAEVRLRTNAIVSDRAAMEQVTREVMSFIAGRQEETRRRRRRAVSVLREIRPPNMPELVEESSTVMVIMGRFRPFEARFPELVQG